MADYGDKFFKNNFNTQLSPQEESEYQKWAKENGREDDDIDYDMRGAWLSNAGQSENGHYPDDFKKPNHPTFSDQSKYHGSDDPNGGVFVAGKWSVTKDGVDTFEPSKEMLQKTHPVWFLKEYMQKVEPNAKLILPE